MYQLTEGSAVIRVADGLIIPNAPGNVDWDRYQVWLSEGGVPLPPPSLPIGDIKNAARARIDALALSRLVSRTDSYDGKATLYLLKDAEARAYLAGQPGPFPFLDASIGVDGPDLDTVAAVIAAKASAFRTIASAVEGARLAAKKAVGTASTKAAIDAIVSSFEEAVSGL